MGRAGVRDNPRTGDREGGQRVLQVEPAAYALPAVSEVRPNGGAEPAIAFEGDPYGRPRWGTPPETLPSIDRIRRNTRWVEVFNRGDTAFTFTATADQPWMRVSPARGSVQQETRLEIGADWPTVPPAATGAWVTIDTSTGARFKIRVLIADTAPAQDSPPGTFVETDGCIAIDAPHYAGAIGQGEIRWQTLEGFGRTMGGVTTAPALAPDAAPGGASPRLTYDLQFATAHEVTLEFQFAPSLDFQPGDGLRFAWSATPARRCSSWTPPSPRDRGNRPSPRARERSRPGSASRPGITS